MLRRPGLTSAHMNWITNIGDCSAAGLIVTAGAALYHKELAKHIQTVDIQHVESDNNEEEGSDSEQGADADS